MEIRNDTNVQELRAIAEKRTMETAPAATAKILSAVLDKLRTNAEKGIYIAVLSYDEAPALFQNTAESGRLRQVITRALQNRGFTSEFDHFPISPFDETIITPPSLVVSF